MKLLDKIPVPHTWTENYPHYIASPKLLKLCYLFIVVSALATFIGSLIYYFCFQMDIISVIGYETNRGDEWKCEAIGAFTGEFSMLSHDNVPSWNLTQSVSTGFADVYDDNLYYTALPYESSDDNYYFDALKPFIYDDTVDDPDSMIFGDDVQSWEERANYYAELANAKTVEDCVTSFTNYACVNSMRNESSDWNLYKFKFQNLTRGYPKTAPVTNIALYAWNATAQSYQEALIYFFMTKFVANRDVAYIYTRDREAYDFDLCDVIAYGKHNNDSLSWGAHMNGDIVPVNVSCERIDNDYCAINVTNAFTVLGNFSAVMDGIPSAMTMIHKNARADGQWVDYTTYMLLGSQLGATCNDRWSKTCQEYFKIAELCKKMYVAPFECKREQRKELWTIISLAFSSSSLIFTTLIVISAFFMKRFAQPVYDKPNRYANAELNDPLL
eukprot:446638_1